MKHLLILISLVAILNPLFAAELLTLQANPHTIAQLRTHNISILAHLDHGKVLIFADRDHVQNIDVPITPWSARNAMTSRLLNTTKSDMRSSGDQVRIIIGFAPTTDLVTARSQLQHSGATVNWTDTTTIRPELGLTISPEQLDDLRQVLLKRTDLVFADVQSRVRLRNSASTWRCQSGETNVTPIFDRGLRGENQIIGIMDTGIDADMCYFRDDDRGLPPTNDSLGTLVDMDQRKVLAVDFYWDQDWPNPGTFDWDSNGHGTHVAGSAAGDSLNFGRHDGDDGMAPAAKLVVQDGGYKYDECGDLPGLGCPMQSLEPMLAQAWAQGARIHSNSWGDEEEAWPTDLYTERTADIDRFVWHHDDMLVLFAAGNSGGWGNNTIGSPGTGKNVVAVGASIHGNFDTPCPVNFSSRGWTHDGRIKPDVIAPGSNIISASSDYRINTMNCNETRMSGTSMACPTVAGLSALVRQYFVDGFYPSGTADPAAGFAPSAALLKATLIASAVDVTRLGCAAIEPIPSRDQGWGVVQLDTALHFADERQSLLVIDDRDGINSDGEITASFSTVGAGPLKVVLVWTDPPSSSTAETNLVNDLDLTIEGPTGAYLGNVFSSGVSVSGGLADRLNNVEVFYLPEAPQGEWELTITPHSLIEGPQSFALVATGNLGENQSRRPRQPLRFSP